jgi:hypothetical protein
LLYSYVHVAKHRTFDQSPKALEDFVIFQMESNRSLFTGSVDKIVMVFDMTGFGLRNMDWRCILFIVKCLEAYYPESLNVMLIHNAPWVFQGIWKLLGPMLDPYVLPLPHRDSILMRWIHSVVRNKVEMTKNTEDLQVHIDKSHLVKQLGGTSDWNWNYVPVVPGENTPQRYVPSSLLHSPFYSQSMTAGTLRDSGRPRRSVTRSLPTTSRPLAHGASLTTPRSMPFVVSPLSS